jgi:propanol-preferring alcohol dehydrogenase
VDFFKIAPQIPIRTHIRQFHVQLSEANEALNRLRNGQIEGAAVLIP